jgi:hypothetical protein
MRTRLRSTGVGSAEGGPEHDRVAGDDQLLDVQVQVGERLVVAADRLGPGRRADPDGLTYLSPYGSETAW